MRRRLAVRVASAILVALLMVLALAGPAAAAKPFQENIDTTVDEVVCGIPVTTHVVGSLRSHIKYDVTDPSNVNHIWFGHINRNLTITFTNAEGDTLVERVRDNLKDEAIVDNGDGTWTFTFSNRGQPQRLIVNGRTVVKDVGKITFQDTVFLGDLTTDDDDAFISSEILGISGPHPEAESDFTLFCEVFEDALG